ncbi:MAG: discoidin domain-containing protein [Candidatus Aminicenantes bacterium]|nr:discoidin domain-containing protein [Candidatus Aminicenantes bacterium]
MEKQKKIQATALLLFFLLALFQLLPLSLHPVDSVHDTGDPLLNTWIFSWVQKSLLSQPSQLFNGNIFYPSKNTISYSEHLLPQAILSLPIALLTGNPIFTYNCLFIFSYIFAAYAMFLLVRHLTRDYLSGIVAGIIFAFSTYHLDHTPQLQLLSSGFFVLSFYFLHRFFQEKKTKYSVLFAFFLMIQALACIYYGLFFISILLIALPLFILFHWKEIDRFFLLKLILPVLAAGAVLLLFSLPYISLLKNSGFSRNLAPGADLANYLGASKKSLLYGKLLSPFGAAERYLFPGFIALFFMGFYIFTNRKEFHNIPRFLRILFFTVISLSLLSFLIISIFDGMSINLGLFEISINNIVRPASIFLFAILGFILLSFTLHLFSKKEKQEEKRHYFYLYVILFFWAFLLSLGKYFSISGQAAEGLKLPFAWLHEYVPGFGGIRAPSRYAVFVLFAIAVMAGFGFRVLATKLKGHRTKILVAGIIIVLLNIEFMSIPQKMRFVPIKKDIPPAYKWLAEKSEDFAIINLPFFKTMGQESVYMYFSIFHEKKMVNGYSGFLPPYYYTIREIFDFFPSRASLDVLKSLKVNYIVLHTGMWKENEAREKMNRILNEFDEDLEFVESFEYSAKKPWEYSEQFGYDFIFKVIPAPESPDELQPFDWKEIPVSDWKVSSNINNHRLLYLRDGNLETRWTTGTKKRSGDHLLLEFEKPLDKTKISLQLASSSTDYGVDFEVEVSTDGEEWRYIEGAYSVSEFLNLMFNSSENLVQNIYIQAKDIKYVKITQSGGVGTFWWSIAELDVFSAEDLL